MHRPNIVIALPCQPWLKDCGIKHLQWSKSKKEMIYVPQVIGQMHSTWECLQERWYLPETRPPLQRRSLREPPCTRREAASLRSPRHNRVSDCCFQTEGLEDRTRRRRFSSHSVSFLVLGIADLHQIKLNIKSIVWSPAQSLPTIRTDSIRFWNAHNYVKTLLRRAQEPLLNRPWFWNNAVAGSFAVQPLV